MAAGVEYSREWFGKGPWRLTDDPAHNGGTNFEPWTTNTTGFLAEYQWNASDRWTAFLGGRTDRHTFTQWMSSPKAAIVFSPAKDHTAKLLYNRSLRKSDDMELKLLNEANQDSTGDIERVSSIELRHDYRAGETLVLSAAAFRQNVDIIGWVGPPKNRTRPIGEEEILGLELEAIYAGRRHSLTGSYAFTKLREFRLLDETIKNQTETSAPYTYGNDLNHWPRHVGKLTWRWQVTGKLKTTCSLRLLWAFRGAEAYTDYNNEVLKQNSLSRSHDGRTDAFEGNAFLNTGAVCNAGRGFQLSLHLHNILGWVRQDLNKRNFYGRMAGYRVEAPAASMRIAYSY